MSVPGPPGINTTNRAATTLADLPWKPTLAPLVTPFDPRMRSAMEPGEKILWCGAPRPGGRLPTAARLVSLGGVFLILIVAAFVLRFTDFERFELQELTGLMPLVLTGSLLAAWGPLETWRRRRATRYLLTDRKMVIFPDGAGGKWIVIHPVPPEELSLVPDGEGTNQVMFCTFPYPWASTEYPQMTLERIVDAENVKDTITQAFRACLASPPPLPPVIPRESPQHAVVFQALSHVLQPEEPVFWIRRAGQRAYAISDRLAYVIQLGPTPIIDAYPPQHWGGFLGVPKKDGLWNLRFSWSSLEHPRRVFPAPPSGGIKLELDSRATDRLDGLRDPAVAVNALIAVKLRHSSAGLPTAPPSNS